MSNKTFITTNLFKRIDYRNKNQLCTLDFVQFLKENGIFINEGDCYFITKQFDTNNDGILNLSDFIKFICPMS